MKKLALIIVARTNQHRVGSVLEQFKHGRLVGILNWDRRHQKNIIRVLFQLHKTLAFVISPNGNTIIADLSVLPIIVTDGWRFVQ
ncbi:hypothetical protein SDC9_181387 [bioreactor metagenome]|uniref:Uncharacterized protein n=1 Tax=bioreactor metagenome TaxID=1076179 RepID=A0A645H4E6_9ZZZZ